MFATSRRLAAAIAVSCAVLLLGCSEGPSGSPGDAEEVRQYVAGSAEQRLGSDGRFTYPQATAPSSAEIISEQRARELTASFVLSFGPASKPFWERERGRAIDVARLSADRRVFFVHTPYELFPGGYHPAFRRAFGPFHLFTLATGREPEVLVAVSAYSTDVGIYPDGKLDMPTQSGMEFVSSAVPIGTALDGNGSLLGPEEAVVRVGRATGARVIEVPELVMLNIPEGPLNGAWKLSLDRGVRVRTTAGAEARTVSTLYLSRVQGRQLLIAATAQPSYQDVPARRIGPAGEDLGHEVVRLPIIPGRPTVFEEVTAGGG
ncbi:MAG TPA: hypothetical protein VF710_21900 [Longimicrobium sp.]|jgi:hypothetical protein